MESVISKQGDRYFAYVATIYKVDGAYCAHTYHEYKTRYFKTHNGACKSTQKFIDLNSHLHNLFMQERKEIDLCKK